MAEPVTTPNEYTPTTEQVRLGYADDGGLAEYYDPINGHREKGYALEQFDRWLAAHDAAVRAQERERCAQIVREERDRLEVVKGTYAQGQRHVLARVWAAIRALPTTEGHN